MRVCLVLSYAKCIRLFLMHQLKPIVYWSELLLWSPSNVTKPQKLRSFNFLYQNDNYVYRLTQRCFFLGKIYWLFWKCLTHICSSVRFAKTVLKFLQGSLRTPFKTQALQNCCRFLVMKSTISSNLRYDIFSN